MKATKLIAAAMFAAMALAIAGRAGAGGGNGADAAPSAGPASHAANHAGIGDRAGLRQHNGRFSRSYQYPYYPYYGNSYYGNGIVENPDEADWVELWTSLYEDNDGPYARSTRENPPGGARMWEFPEK